MKWLIALMTFTQTACLPCEWQCVENENEYIYIKHEHFDDGEELRFVIVYKEEVDYMDEELQDFINEASAKAKKAKKV